MGLFVEYAGERLLWISWGPLRTTTIWRARLCYNNGHFPLGYLVMGKNVFSQINDMFIQKEVTTLFRSSAASKFERKNESKQERETDWECSFWSCFRQKPKPYVLYIVVIPSVRVHQGRNLTRPSKLASNGTSNPNSSSLCDLARPPSV